MASPDPPHHPTPTPTPKPTDPGYYSPGDYLAACCDKLKNDYPDMDVTLTAGEVLEYVEKIKNVIVAAET